MRWPDRIYLVGMPGSGKSTLGRQLAKSMNCRFVDLDSVIEHKTQLTIKEIFQSKGEEAFRKIESEALLEVSSNFQTVIATGGGTPCFYGNLNIINNSGVSIFLNVPVDELHTRLNSTLISDRPKLSGTDKLLDELVNTLRQRMSFYKEAHHQLMGKNITVQKIIDRLKEDSKSH